MKSVTLLLAAASLASAKKLFATQTLLEIIGNDPEQVTTFGAVIAAGLTETIGGEDDITFFAPTNAAWANFCGGTPARPGCGNFDMFDGTSIPL